MMPQLSSIEIRKDTDFLHLEILKSIAQWVLLARLQVHMWSKLGIEAISRVLGTHWKQSTWRQTDRVGTWGLPMHDDGFAPHFSQLPF